MASFIFGSLPAFAFASNVDASEQATTNKTDKMDSVFIGNIFINLISIFSFFLTLRNTMSKQISSSYSGSQISSRSMPLKKKLFLGGVEGDLRIYYE